MEGGGSVEAPGQCNDREVHHLFTATYPGVTETLGLESLAFTL